MKLSLIINLSAILIILSLGFRDNSHIPLKMYNRNGIMYMGSHKIFVDTFAINGSTKNIDISVAEFEEVHTVVVSGIKNSSSTSNMPWINIENYTTSSVNLKVYQPNSNTISLGGSVVALGAPVQDYSSPTNTYVTLTICGQ